MNDVSTITSDLNAMKQYLKDIYTLETNRICLNKDAIALNDKIAPLGHSRIKEPYVKDGYYYSLDGLRYPVEYHRTKLVHSIDMGISFPEDGTRSIGFITGLIAGLLIGILVVRRGVVDELFDILAVRSGDVGELFVAFMCIFMFAIIGAVGGLIVIPIIVQIIGDISMDKYRKYQYKHRLEAIERDKKQLEQERKEEADRLAEENRAKDTLTEAYDSTISTYNSCEQNLLYLYDMDIVYAKYRNLTAMAQIYEYFMSDRVKTLGEAYNLYEQEIRMNKIITQFDEAISLLEEIRDSQYALVSSIQQSNSLLAQIESATSAIATNTAIMTYNTSVIASNTEIMARYTV